MFTKQHYEVLAQLIAKSRNLMEFERKLATFLEQDSPRFNTAKFWETIIILRQSKLGVHKDECSV
jgi:hypothetical protein